MITVLPNTINIVHNQAKNNLDLETLFISFLNKRQHRLFPPKRK